MLVVSCADVETETSGYAALEISLNDVSHRKAERSKLAPSMTSSDAKTILAVLMPAVKCESSSATSGSEYSRALVGITSQNVKLVVPLDTQVKLCLFFFRETLSLNELSAGTTAPEGFGESGIFSIDSETTAKTISVEFWTTSYSTVTLKISSISSIGFEDQDVSYATYQSIVKAVGDSAKLVPMGEAVNRLRIVKDRGELAVVEKAVAIADEVMEIALASLEEGITEQAVARTVERSLWEFGADGAAFETIVASGPNASRPHNKPGDRVIQLGDVVVIDMGAVFAGYRSDITRTICMGKANEQFNEVYHVVHEAQRSAEELAGPGVNVAALDAVARDVIHSYGYGKYFTHGLGHGIGLDVHELPRISGGSDEVLSEGMVFTIEPGIYIPGWGGVRIEDMLVIDKEEARILTQSDK